MLIARGWPVACATLAVVSLATIPLAYDSGPALGAVVALGLASAGAARVLRRKVPLDLNVVRAVAHPVLPYAGQEPLAVTRPWVGAGSLVGMALVLALWGGIFAGNDTTGWSLGVVYWTLAVVMLGFALAWPYRLRRAARTAPTEVDVVGWTERQSGYVWLLLAPANATSIADVVGFSLRKGIEPPRAFAGRLRVHGRLAPWHVAIVRAPDGTAYWPRGACLGSTRLAAKHIDAQPGA